MSEFGRKRYHSHDSRGVLPGKRDRTFFAR
jgi:hypothetical protein